MILQYRGKTIKGSWVVGHVSVVTNSSVGVKPGTYISNSFGMPFAYEVRPETVGQATGVYDMNTTEIYCDDIVKGLYGHDEIQGPVEFMEGAFCIVVNGIGTLISECNRTEILGNIHDNAEVLLAH